MVTGNTTAATESEAATLKPPDVAADVFPTLHPSLQEEAAQLPHYTPFPPFLDPAISTLACHPSTVQWEQVRASSAQQVTATSLWE